MGVDAEAGVKRGARAWRRLTGAIAVVAWFPLVSVVWPSRPYLVDLLAQISMNAGVGACIVGALLLAMRRSRHGLITLVGGLAALSIGTFWAWRGASGSQETAAQDARSVRVRVVSYNAHANISTGDELFAHWLISQDADLVCVVDPPTDFPNDNPLIKQYFPYAAAPQYGMDWPVILLSRTPIESTELVPYAEATKFSLPARRTLRVTVDDSAQVLFTAMYPRSPRNYTYWKQSIASVGVDAGVVRRWLAARPEGSPPLIIAGDFNSTPTGRTHAIMRTSGLRPWSSAFGAGTFPSWLPPWMSLPLDRVWISRDVIVDRWRVGPRLKSDHRPIVIDLLVEVPRSGHQAARVSSLP